MPEDSEFSESELEEFRRMGEEADRIAMPLFLKQFSFQEDAEKNHRKAESESGPEKQSS